MTKNKLDEIYKKIDKISENKKQEIALKLYATLLYISSDEYDKH